MGSIAATCLRTRRRAGVRRRKQRFDAEGALRQGEELGIGQTLGLIEPGAAQHTVLVVEAEQPDQSNS